MNTTPTVTIKGDNGEPCLINIEDYDEKKHTLIVAETKEKPKTEVKFNRKDAMAKLKEAGVEFAGNAKNEVLEKLVADLEKAPAEKTFAVEAKDDKFVIVDGEGVRVGEDDYATEEDANAMVSLLKGE